VTVSFRTPYKFTFTLHTMCVWYLFRIVLALCAYYYCCSCGSGIVCTCMTLILLYCVYDTVVVLMVLASHVCHC